MGKICCIYYTMNNLFTIFVGLKQIFMNIRKLKREQLLKKLYRMHEDTFELRDFFLEYDYHPRMLQHVHYMQHRITYFIEKIKFD